MKKVQLLLIAVALASVPSNTFAKAPHGSNKIDSTKVQHHNKSAACSPAVGLRYLEFNDVRALIETGGNMWQDRSTSAAGYFVPKEGNVASLYAGALWIGGKGLDNQLKVAAVTFRNQGNDFWPGPLSNETAEITGEVCSAYDRFFDSSKQDALLHRQYHTCLNDPDCSVSEVFPNGYTYPSYFDEWPAHGDVLLGQDFYLAPYFDFNPEDGPTYQPENGDYPFYDIDQEIDCQTRNREDIPPLFGDRNLYWIFNDKGNIHTESQGLPIGMEIRAQAFSFATQDEINKMTFYNYVLINQGSQTLNETYFGQWVDPDLGNPQDDFVGCDVQRGLGFCYNAFEIDEDNGAPGWGANPPAVGVDFFEGPYENIDSKDNPLTEDLPSGQYEIAMAEGGIPYSGIGLGYGDGIVDNERLGMRKFVYYDRGLSGDNTDPVNASDYYNYLRGNWKNGQRMSYGGNAFSTNTDLNQPADYMFPGDSDKYGWGTGGNVKEPWSERNANNGQPNNAFDRRFVQSAGPFTLKPGSYNNITVGVVWARATSGGPDASLALLKSADDKAQTLFDSCFEILEGPTAPDVSIQELDQEIILYLNNDNILSSNHLEGFVKLDPSIPGSNSEGAVLEEEERSYVFQGYQIYQVKNETVTGSDLSNVELARLIASVDKEDDVVQIINYDFDPDLGLPIPVEKVNGENQGIQHSFSIQSDLFALESKDLVNYKTYYFMAIAYAHNDYETFQPTEGLGQAKPYLPSGKSTLGNLQLVSAIPHPVATEENGIVLQSSFGEGVVIRQLEGFGNGKQVLDLTKTTESAILSSENSRIEVVSYAKGMGPVDIKVIDPVALKDASFELRLAANGEELDEAADWELIHVQSGKSIISDQSIEVRNEQLLLDYGISITIEQYDEGNDFSRPLEASISYKDTGKPWYLGIPDGESTSPQNWIRSGNFINPIEPSPEDLLYQDFSHDPEALYEELLGGTWAPFVLGSFSRNMGSANATDWQPEIAPKIDDFSNPIGSIYSDLRDVNNIDIVFTADKHLWTRCAVLEMNPDQNKVQNALDTETPNEPKMWLRQHPSVDKNGRTAEDPLSQNADLGGTQPYGMGYFPGYAIDLETGERLNMAFGEDSFLGSENGRDMLWNPSSTLINAYNEFLGGGQHWIYVFRNQAWYEDKVSEEGETPQRIGAYDEGQDLYDMLFDHNTNRRKNAFRACTWIGSGLINAQFPLTSIEKGLIPTETRVKLRVAKSYDRRSAIASDTDDASALSLSENNWNPLYTFSTSAASAIRDESHILASAMDDINVVPNPYYGSSGYERNKLDNRIKIINLPEDCSVSIYTINGTLVRHYKKSDPLTFLDWDLRNENQIPIASGVYIIHIEAHGIGEKVLKWFGVIRPTDLDNF